MPVREVGPADFSRFSGRRRPYWRTTYDGRRSDSGFFADLLAPSAAGTPPRPSWAGGPAEDRRSAFAAVGAELYAHGHRATAGNRHVAEMKLKRAARPDTEQPAI